MTEWRIQGFVGDSEEENEASDEDIISLGAEFQPIEDVLQIDRSAFSTTGVQEEFSFPHHVDDSHINDTYEETVLEHLDQLRAESLELNTPNGTLLRLATNENTGSSSDVSARPHDRTSQRERQDLDDGATTVTSSPLSEVPSSYDVDLEYFGGSRKEMPSAQRLELDSLSYHSNQGDDLSIYEFANGQTESVQRDSAGRVLRRRNPIQLHPYLLESEQYRRSLKARGLRPVEVATERHSPSREDGHESNQESQDVDGGNFSDIRSQNSSQSIYYSSPPTGESLLPTDFPTLDTPDEGFPDLASILRQPLDQSISVGFKRRRIAQNLPNPGHRIVEKESLGTITSQTASPVDSPLAYPAETDQLFISPPTSAPQVPKASKRLRLKKFKIPRGVTPTPLPTPLPSSDLPDHVHHIFNVDSSDEEMTLPVIAREDDTELNSGAKRSSNPQTTDSESSDSDIRQVRQAQKKTKGVLPASWARLDKQAQSLQNKDVVIVRKGVASKPALMQRGVAKRVAHANSLSHSDPSGLVDVDESGKSFSSDEVDSLDVSHPTQSDSLARRISLLRKPEQLVNLFTDDTQEVIEEDWIDDMLPPITRRKNTGQMGRGNHQPRITTAFQKKSRIHDSTSGYQNLQVQKKRSTAVRRQNRVTRHRGVLDAPISSTSEAVPDFIRVASRQARSRRDRGRHSPSKKTIILHNGEDQNEVQIIMRNWRDGTIQLHQDQRHDTREMSNFRPPLREQAANQQQRIPKPTERDGVRLRDRKLSRIEPSSRKQMLSLPRKHRKSQSRIEPLLESEVRSENPEARPVELMGDRSKNTSDKRVPKRTFPQPKPAQLEDLEEENDFEHPEAAFKRNLSRIDRQFEIQDTYRNGASKPPIERLLENSQKISKSPTLACQSNPTYRKILPLVTGDVPISVDRRRKRPPRQHIARIERIIFDSTIHPAEVSSLPSGNLGVCHQITLDGLQKLGSSYSIDFNILPLPTGTYFHETTVIGSGILRDALVPRTREVDTNPRASIITFGENTTKWALWNEEVSSELGSLCNYVRSITESAVFGSANWASTSLEEEIRRILQDLTQYFSRSLSFTDAIDRRSFVSKSAQELGLMFDDIQSITVRLTSGSFQQLLWSRIRPCWLTFLLLLVYQVLKLCDDPVVDIIIRQPIEHLMKSVSYAILRNVLHGEMTAVQEVFEKVRTKINRDRGIREESMHTESLAILIHVLGHLNEPRLGFWTIVNDLYLETLQSSTLSAEAYEQIWKSIFYLIPFFDFDSLGIIKSTDRNPIKHGDWTLIKTLLGRILEVYSSNTPEMMPMVNTYVRAILCRCYYLIQTWHWRGCEPALNVMFDFFARNQLALLAGEEGRGSPRFLEELQEGVVPSLDKSDNSFHIFLKVLGAGLIGMRETYDAKRIRSIAWRFIPNHGRLYKKDEELRQCDLDALRNHHDLLCVLYWASPITHRPSLDMIRNLVDFGSSHLEACRLNVRAWANLARFMVSAEEPVDEFSVWYNNILRNLIGQHQLARTEAEAFYSTTNATVSRDLLQSVINTNQRQIEAVITSALNSLKDVLQQATDIELPSVLFLKSAINEVFKIFDSTQPRTQGTISMALDVFSAYVTLTESYMQKTTQQSNEDSQDYGDWPMYNEITESEARDKHDLSQLDEFATSPLFQLLSNAFGADIPPTEVFLMKLVDTWVSMARVLVNQGQQEWTRYIDSNGQYCWHQLQNTEPTRKYLAYFLSRAINSDLESYHQHSNAILSAWMVSLVERESVLKFQHQLTSCILNAVPEEELLRNVPFTRSHITGAYQITLSELRERRLSLISSLFSNMREAVEKAFINSHGTANLAIRQELATMLKVLMGAMKRNYLDTQGGSSTRGSYVAFVQNIVELLQQYTAEICPVDKFFTESADFPLPTNDPMYVVGRLKSYGVNYVESKSQKKLAVFLQTISERAAVAAQQQYLVEQLHKAISGSFERSEYSMPSLRRVALQAIFPVYIECSLRSVHGWILAWPILAASKLIFADHLYHFSITDALSTAASCDILTSFCESVRSALEPVFTEHIQSFVQPHVLLTIRYIFEAIESLLHLVDYLSRSDIRINNTLRNIEFFAALAAHLLYAPSFECRPSLIHLPPESKPELRKRTFSELRSFSQRELQDANRYWAVRGNDYYLSKGHTSKLVVIEIGSLEVERRKLVGVAQQFLRTAQRLGLQGDVEVGSLRSGADRLLGAELLF